MNEIKVLPASWRDILKASCDSLKKKQEIANAVGITVRTVDRWISDQSNPQPQKMRKLALLSNEMRLALQHAFPEAFQSGSQSSVGIERAPIPFEQALIPTEYYRRVARAYANVPSSSQRWTMWHLISNQMLSLLDPDELGLVLLCLCQRTDGLHVVELAGTAIWATRQSVIPDILIKEDWLMQAAQRGSPLFVQCTTPQMVPPSSLLQSEQIRSMGFFPLYRAGRSVGGMFLGAATEDFFTVLRKALIEEYSWLMVMAHLLNGVN